jgi:HK97 family phage major capsid protein
MPDIVPAEPKKSAADVLAEIRNGIDASNKRSEDLLSKFGDLEKRVGAVELKKKTRTVALAKGGYSLPGVEDEKKEFSICRAALAIRERNPAIAPFEWDVMQECFKANEPFYAQLLAQREAEHRDMSTDVDTAAGFLVPEQALSGWVEMLRAATVAEELGATVLTGLTGAPVKIDKQTGDVTAYWVTEAGLVTNTDIAVGEITLYPREAAARVKVSNRLLQMANPAFEGKVRESMAKQTGLLQDLAILQGTGGTQPLGILNQTDLNTTSMTAVPTPDMLFDMIYQIEVDNAAGNDMGWAFHPRTWHTLRKTKDGEGNYILIPREGSITAGTLLGLPFKTTTQIPITLGAGAASRLYVGRWSEAIVGRWGGMEIAVSKETDDAFERRQTHILLTSLMDTAVRHGQSFCLDSTVAS